MGQQCTKENKNGITSQVLSENNIQQRSNANAQQNILRQIINHVQLDNINDRLQYNQLQKLLDIHRSRCKDERKFVCRVVDKSGIVVANRKLWKRLTINETTLFNTFPSLSHEGIRNQIKSVIKSNDERDSLLSGKLYESVDNLEVVGKQHLLQAFQIASHLFRPDEILSNGNKCSNETTLQDFSTALAICLHGSREEMLIFLFLLFSDTVAANAPVSSSTNAGAVSAGGSGGDASKRFSFGRGSIKKDEVAKENNTTRKRSYTDSHVMDASAADKLNLDIIPQSPTAASGANGQNTHARRGNSFNDTDKSAGDVVSNRTRHSSFDQPGNPASYSLKAMAASITDRLHNPTHTSSVTKYTKTSSSNNGFGHSDSSRLLSSSSPLQHNHNALLSRMAISESGIYKLILFYLLAHRNSSHVSASDLHNSFESSSDAQLRETVIDLVSKISLGADAGRHSGGSTGISFDSFMGMLYHDSSLDNHIGYVASGLAALTLTKMIQRGASLSSSSLGSVSLNVTSDSLRKVLHIFVDDHAPNPFKVLKMTRDFFNTESHKTLLHTLSLMTDKQLVQTPLPDHHVFLIDAKWWQTWCDAMEVTPLFAGSYFPSLDRLVIGLKAISRQTLDVAELSSSDEVDWKYLRCDAFSKDAAHLSSALRLRNSRLVVKNRLGVRHLRDDLAPDSYIALPFALGEALYRRYDRTAATVPASVYKRRLNFCSSAVAQQDTPRGGLVSSVANFITNFYATNSCFLELTPHLVPLYYCTSAGLASKKHSDFLVVRTSNASHTILNEGVAAQLTILDFIIAQYRDLLHVTSVEVARDCRLWGLYESNKSLQQRSPEVDRHVLCHTSFTEWHLLTSDDTDFSKDVYALVAAGCIGLMIETKNTEGAWPTDRVVPVIYLSENCGGSRSSSAGRLNGMNNTIVTSESPNEEDMSLTSSSSGSNGEKRNKMCFTGPRRDIFHIGQLVDVMADNDCYYAAEVISIARDHLPDNTLAMLVTLRLAAAANDTPVTDSVVATGNDVAIVPYYSPRILPRAVVTGTRSTEQGSTLGSTALWTSELISNTDKYARSVNLLSVHQTVGGSRTVLHRRFRTIAKPGPVVQLSAINKTVSGGFTSPKKVHPAVQPALTNGKAQNGTNSAGSVSEEEADSGADDEASLPSQQLERPRRHSQSSVVSGAHSPRSNSGSVNNSRPSTAPDTENGANKGSKSNISSFFSPNKAGTVIPLNVDTTTLHDEGGVTGAVSREEHSVVFEEKEEDGEAVQSLVRQEVEEEVCAPTTTLTADQAQLYRIIAESGEDCPRYVRLLYDIICSEASLLALKDQKVNAIDTQDAVFKVERASLESSSAAAVVSSNEEDAAKDVQPVIVVQTRETNQSITESGISTDTAGTQNTDPNNPYSGSLGPKKKRLHAKSIGKACSSLSKSINRALNGQAGMGSSSGNSYRKTSERHGGATVEMSNSIITINSQSANRVSVSGNGGLAATIGLTGLNNLGNTCFLSSALQCLTKTPIFVLYFLTQQYKFDLNTANTLGSKGKVTEEFARFLFTIYNPNAAAPETTGGGGMFGKVAPKNLKSVQSAAAKFDSMSPTALLKAFQQHKPYFTGADQQDAQEFLSELLDTFHEDLKRKKPTPVAVITESSASQATLSNVVPVVDGGSDQHSSDSGGRSSAGKEMSVERILEQGSAAWEQYTASNNSVISNMFQGQLCSKVTCKLCTTVSVKFEPFTTLSLSIPKVKTGPNSSGVSDTVTITLTVYRKMPRLFLLKRYLTICQQLNADSTQDTVEVVDAERLLDYYRAINKPMRIAISVSRQATVQDIKNKAVELLNAIEEEAGSASPAESAKTAMPDLEKLPPISAQHTTVIDISGEEKGRIKKILENREGVSSLVDDFQSDYSLLLLENNKNLPFISSLPANRLLPSGGKSSKKALLDPHRDWKALCWHYSDELEYSSSHCLGNNDLNFEGRLLADLDNIYSKDSVALHHPSHAKSGSSGGFNGKTAHSSSRGSMKEESGHGSAPSARPAVIKYDNSVDWPASIDQFAVGDRVDALDHKGSWFSGSVLDVFDISEADIKTCSLAKHARDKDTRSKPVTPSAAGSGPAKQKLTPGVHIRVHFDNFSSIWDEWFDQRDYERGFIFPIYTKTQRKLKIFDLQVVQRRLLPADNSPANSPKNGATATTGTNGESEEENRAVRIDVFDVPIVVQAESYRSLHHVHRHICEQMTRFMSPDDLSALIRSKEKCFEGVHDRISWPFTLRLLSSNNLLSAPLEVVNNNNNTTGEVESDGKESYRRFYDYKCWEGSDMPHETFRPAVNLFHSRLIIAVDWFTTCDFGELMKVMGPQDLLPQMVLKRSLTPFDHDSYAKYVAILHQKQLALQAQQQPPVTTAPSDKFVDNRVGLSIEHLLSKFVGVEDIDEYYCDCCRKLCPGILHTSIHLLPDILILHLKRLVMNATGGGKIRTLVKFPLVDLDMCPYITENMADRTAATETAGEVSSDQNSAGTLTPSLVVADGRDAAVTSEPTSEHSEHSCAHNQYELYGVVNHLGGMYGGHYTAVAKCEHIQAASPPASQPPATNTPQSVTTSSTTAGAASNDTDETGTEEEPQNHKQERCASSALSLADYLYPHSPHTSADTANNTVKSNNGGSGNSGVEVKKKWLKFDDEFVMEVSTANNIETAIVTESAYLLFYQRKAQSPRNLLKYL